MHRIYLTYAFYVGDILTDWFRRDYCSMTLAITTAYIKSHQLLLFLSPRHWAFCCESKICPF